MKSSYILVIDTGSSSMRGLLYNQDGCLVFCRRQSYFMEVTGDSAQQESSCYRDALLAITRGTAKECAARSITPAALAFTSQRSSVLALTDDGQPLYPVLMWYDKRSAPVCQSFSAQQLADIHQISGQRLTPVLSAPKMLWLKQTHPRLYERAHKLTGIHDYLLYLCTKQFVTDASLAGRTCLFDIRRRDWSAELITLFGLDSSKLCRVLPVGSIVGSLCASFAQESGLPKGIPVITAGGDQQCSLLGQGVSDAGDIGITSGTASYVCALSESPEAGSAQWLNTGIAASPGRYITEASNMASGSVYDWFLRTFYEKGASVRAVGEDALLSPAGANELIMLPYLAGKGCPQWNAAARGSFRNIDLRHTRADFARALLEGLSAEIAECFSALSEYCKADGVILSSGGLSRLPLFNQMIADMIARPVTVCSEEETTGLGAWINAALALGLYGNAKEAARAKRNSARIKNPKQRPVKVFTPDSARTLLYQKQAETRRYLMES